MEKKKIVGKKVPVAKKAVKTVSKSKPIVGETLAVLELGGSQHLIKEGTQLTVHHLPIKEGVKAKAKVTVLEPTIREGTATYKIVEHLKGSKIVVMKYKAKSRYRKKRGFRASLSKVVVEKIETK
ncbi:MAG: 50S ribosomal protein L21 [candidate division WWE3 bacterium]|nr:50S ribosomal protein L21 [candidate division WWE3 bacterium]